MKSLIVAVFWPAWEWVNHPEIRSLFASYAQDLALRDSVRCRDLIESDWYTDWFQPDWELKSDQNLKTWFANDKSGFRMALGVGGKTTGFRGHKVVVDDPHNAKDATSDAVRSEQNTWWFRRASTRVNDVRKRVRVVVMQRLHDQDLSGEILSKGGYEHLNLPMEFDPERAKPTSLGFRDPRKEKGELLFPARFPESALVGLRRDLGSASYAGQYNQSPAPAGGLMFKRSWWRYWQPKGLSLPPVRVDLEDGSFTDVYPIDLPDMDEHVQSWDMTFKATAGADNVAGGVWGRAGARAFLLDQVCRKMTFPETLTAVRTLSEAWPQALAKYIEDKANGPAVIATLSDEIPGLIPINPGSDGKVARANAVLPAFEAGNVFAPHPLIFDWVEAYLGEHDNFPNGSHDDQVDQTTQAIKRLLAGGAIETTVQHFDHGLDTYDGNFGFGVSDYRPMGF